MAWGTEAKLTASTGSTNGDFGLAVARRDTTIAIGAPHHPAPGDAGAVSLFIQSGAGFAETQVLEVAGTRELGCALALGADTLVAGACRDGALGALAGAAYVFERGANGFVPVQTLLAPDGQAGDFFGTSVALDGDTLAVGAPGVDGIDGTWGGAVYVFARVAGAFAFAQKLVDPGGAGEDRFGQALALAADELFVGSPRRAVLPGLGYRGALCAFVRAGATFTGPAVLFANGTSAELGLALAFDGDVVLVAGKEASAGAGMVYAFERVASGWTSTSRIDPPAGATLSGFGSALALRAGEALVGSPHDSAVGHEAGAVYRVVRADAGFSPPLRVAVPAAAGDRLGAALALDTSGALAGAPRAGGTIALGGAAYVLGQHAELGVACSAGGDCASGHCADGVCCDRACDAACEVCRGSLGLENADGECGTARSCAAPRCAGDGASVLLPDGAVNGCAPYACDGAVGACYGACASGAECAPGHRCASSGVCEAPAAEFETGCRVSRSSRRSAGNGAGSWFALALGWWCGRARRRTR